MTDISSYDKDLTQIHKSGAMAEQTFVFTAHSMTAPFDL